MGLPLPPIAEEGEEQDRVCELHEFCRVRRSVSSSSSSPSSKKLRNDRRKVDRSLSEPSSTLSKRLVQNDRPLLRQETSRWSSLSPSVQSTVSSPSSSSLSPQRDKVDRAPVLKRRVWVNDTKAEVNDSTFTPPTARNQMIQADSFRENTFPRSTRLESQRGISLSPDTLSRVAGVSPLSMVKDIVFVGADKKLPALPKKNVNVSQKTEEREEGCQCAMKQEP